MPARDEQIDDLERRLDAPGFRRAARLALLWQTRARRPKPVRRPLTLAPTEPGQLVTAMADAMAEGALETAERLVEHLLTAPGALGTSGARGQALAVEVLLMLGQRERARELAEQHVAALATQSVGAAMLELVGSRSAPDFLPDGRPSLLRLSRRVARGELDARSLTALLGTSARRWLRTPELHLLLFSALLANDPPRALRFLNRFLALHGTPRCQLRPGVEPLGVLDRLCFEAPAPARQPRALVSIVVAARDAAKTIGYAVESLLRQSYPALEILVGDDASHDDTLGVLQRRWPREPRLRLFRSNGHQGPYNLRNALVRQARGELLTFHDADDLAFPDRIARQAARVERPSRVACVANFARVRADGSFVFFKDQRAVRLGMVTLMLKRSAFDAVGPFRSARVGADLELYNALRVRFGEAAISRVKSPVMLGLWSESSATRTATTESLEDGFRSAARRGYSELLYAQRQAASGAAYATAIEERLRELGNLMEPAGLHEIS